MEEVNDNDTESGIVMEQSPSANTELVAADEEVTLTVSIGPADITLRDLTTYSKQAASNYLEDNGLKLDEKEAHSDEVPKGEVMKQEPGKQERLLNYMTRSRLHSLLDRRKNQPKR